MPAIGRAGSVGRLEVVAEVAAEREQVGHFGGKAEVALKAHGARRWQFADCRTRLLEHLGGRRDRHEIRLREVAIVVRLLLRAQRGERAASWIEVQRLLCDFAAAFDNRALALDLSRDAALEEAKRVHVLELGFRPERRRAGRAQRDVGVGSQRALLHVDVADAEASERRAQQREPLAGMLTGAQLGLGDDLDQRRTAAVEVDNRLLRTVDATARTEVDQLRRVLFEVDAVDRDVGEPAAAAERLVVLGDLVALGQVGIEVVLAVEDRALGQIAAERQADHQPEMDRSGVDDRQRTGQPEADRTGPRVRRLAEGQLAAAEHLRRGLQLDVDLEADHRLQLDAHWRTALPSKPSACSSAKAASSSRLSLNAGPTIWRPTGSRVPPPRGSARALGIEIAGTPASDAGTVQKSLRYIASGSASFAPSSNATPGAVGVTMKSKCSKAVAKSSAIFVRTRCARP